ncbi:GTP pyrophosphokinase family protein [Paenibacillus mucilaginosus]|uniref:GTP pyrophosphokinase n=1 Tax=Paenibacillus mucilaginosus TaxID=61624 RepID=UPI00240E814F|nr:GTP pyrophosphokinase family protein [Paenibacillus mucilaginosus]WFA16957.1 GTP pyrophosphokinase family protein [Paenibacillus mucilaginosus]
MEKRQIDQLRDIRNKVTRFMMMYKFALEELETKINILNEEFHLLHEYNPIEHTKSRIKSPESILEKLNRKGGGESLASIKETIRDIAGLRITCSFVEDIYWISEMLKNQSDLHVVEIKDYIKNPKPNGYRSLHLLVQVPVFMSDRQEPVYVEVQIRTIAMDFWASLEHKIFYKYDGSVPPRLLEELKDAADSATALDRKMEKLHKEIEAIKSAEEEASEGPELLEQLTGGKGLPIPEALLRLAGEGQD